MLFLFSLMVEESFGIPENGHELLRIDARF